MKCAETITVFLNDQPKRAFFGMRVRNVLSARLIAAVNAHRAEIRDAEGNRVDVDGALYDGERLYVAKTTAREYANGILKRAQGA